MLHQQTEPISRYFHSPSARWRKMRADHQCVSISDKREQLASADCSSRLILVHSSVRKGELDRMVNHVAAYQCVLPLGGNQDRIVARCVTGDGTRETSSVRGVVPSNSLRRPAVLIGRTAVSNTRRPKLSGGRVDQ